MASIFNSGKAASKDARFQGTDIDFGVFGGVDVSQGPRGFKGELDVGINQGSVSAGNIQTGQDLQNFGAAGILDTAGGASQFGLGGAGGGFIEQILSGLNPTDFQDPELTKLFAGTGGNIGLDFLLNNDFSDIADETTELLRARAKPGQEQLVSRTADKLFSRGGLGASAVSNPAFFDLDRQIADQDLGFQLAGLQRGDDLGKFRQTLGAGLFGNAGNLALGADQLGLQADLFGSNEMLGIAGAQTNLFGTAGTLGLQSQGQNFDQLFQTFGAGTGLTQQQFGNMITQLQTSLGFSTGRSGANAAAGGLAVTDAANLTALGTSAIGAVGAIKSPASITNVTLPGDGN